MLRINLSPGLTRAMQVNDFMNATAGGGGIRGAQVTITSVRGVVRAAERYLGSNG